MMKKLSKFERFDFAAFMKGKKIAVTNISEYRDYDTQEHIGSKVKVAIIEDHTDYGDDEEENKTTNKYEHMVFKVSKDVNIPIDTVVTPKGVTAKIYGQYRNELSLYCEDIIPVGSGKENPNA